MSALRPVVGLITIGQSPRVDVVPDMAELIGPGVEIREAGALDGLGRPQIDALAPGPGDDIFVTRLADGAPVFVAKRHITPRVVAKVAELERGGATLTALLCTGTFERLAASRTLLQPQQVLLGVLRGMRWPGRLGVLTPSVPHVPQTQARWRADGFDPVVVPLSPYDEEDPAALVRAADLLRAAGAGLVVLDCIGFRRKTKSELQGLTGAPVLLASLLVARVIAEICGA
ncbi:MAG: AroM protein [Candidatus Rokuibacteriota bacterium]|nr:MAG: AroM protein [Candidatus Rokubacteria bacterium]PYN70352.1 MAG: AroM protein [Candidatus Rokubacteria bacterium]